VFDIGFSELLLIGVIGLLVLGPERLPTAVRTASLWIGRIRRQFNEIRTEVEREIGADEIRAQLRNEAIMDELRQSREALESSARDIRSSVELPAPERKPEAVPEPTPAPERKPEAVPAPDSRDAP
jgi:sec-independent protein translocase protein TatB